MITKELALTIYEIFQKDYTNRPIWQTMIDIENLIDKHRTKQLILSDVGCSLPTKDEFEFELQQRVDKNNELNPKLNKSAYSVGFRHCFHFISDKVGGIR